MPRLVCPRCRREFHAFPSQVRKQRKYCSNACRIPVEAERWLHPCACGCGELTHGVYRKAHRPTKHYREKGSRRKQAGGRLHRQRAEAAIGHALSRSVVVHHPDHDIDNPTARLVVCQDTSYHRLLHMRERVLRAGGNPNTDSWCSMGQHVQPQTAFYRRRGGKLSTSCRVCLTAYNQRRRHRATA